MRLKVINTFLISPACKKMSTPGVNFIKVFLEAFTCADPKNVKRYWRLNWNVTLSISAHIKAARRMLMKLTPDSRGSHTVLGALMKKNNVS